MNIEPRQTIIKHHGGKGSGNWGHSGRAGFVGGSGIGGSGRGIGQSLEQEALNHKSAEEFVEQFTIKQPKLNSKEISNLARDLDYGNKEEAIEYLKQKGVESIDGYHVSKIEDKNNISNNGIETGISWYRREESVYFFADPDDIKNAIPYLAMKIEGNKGGNILVTHFQIPIKEIKKMEWDGFFASQFESYSSFRIEKNIPKEQISEFKLFNIPSDIKYKKNKFVTKQQLIDIYNKVHNHQQTTIIKREGK